jgi:hypothetical protein
VGHTEAAGAHRRARASSTLGSNILTRVAISQTVSCTLGALVVFALLWLVLPAPRGVALQDAAVLLPNAVAFVVFLPLSIAIGTAWGYRLAGSFRPFLLEERPATEAERVATLRHPWRAALVAATLWAAAAVLFVAVNARFSAGLASTWARRSSSAGCHERARLPARRSSSAG